MRDIGILHCFDHRIEVTGIGDQVHGQAPMLISARQLTVKAKTWYIGRGKGLFLPFLQERHHPGAYWSMLVPPGCGWSALRL